MAFEGFEVVLLGLLAVTGPLLEREGFTVVDGAVDGGRLRLLFTALNVAPGLLLGAVKALTRLSTSPATAVDGFGRGSGLIAEEVDVDGGCKGLVDTVTACFGGDFKRESKRMSFWIFWTIGDTCGTFLGEKDSRVDSTTGFPRGLDLVRPLALTLPPPGSLVDSRTGAPSGFLVFPLFFKTGLGGSSWKGGEASWSTACSVALLHN